MENYYTIIQGKIQLLSIVFLLFFGVAQAQYCPGASMDCSDSDEIINVTFAGINHNSTCDDGVDGYSDFTSTTAAQVTPGQNYTLTVSIPEHFGISSTGAWIDFNNNGVFDTHEFYFLGNLDWDAGVLSIPIQVPFDAAAATVRMRIKHIYAGFFSLEEDVTEDSACTDSINGYGETEDYSVSITPLADCSGTPAISAPIASKTNVCPAESFTLSLTNDYYAGITHQWEYSTDNGATWHNLGAAQISPTYTVGAQPVNTTYRVTATCSHSGLNTTSTTISITTNTNITACYCTYETDIICSDGDLITNVTFAGINHNSGCTDASGYTDYTQTIAPALVTAGNNYTINVTVGPSGEGWEFESAGVWIDYNQNGNFEESEFTYIGTGLAEVLSTEITIPSDAIEGTTRMRVANMAMEAAGFNHTFACIASDYGEVEDYLITIENNMSVTDNLLSKVAVFPNPTTGMVTLQTQTLDFSSIKVFSLTGQAVYTKTIPHPTNSYAIDLQDLASGSYFITLTTEAGNVTKKLLKQ